MSQKIYQVNKSNAYCILILNSIVEYVPLTGEVKIILNIYFRYNYLHTNDFIIIVDNLDNVDKLYVNQ